MNTERLRENLYDKHLITYTVHYVITRRVLNYMGRSNKYLKAPRRQGRTRADATRIRTAFRRFMNQLAQPTTFPQF